MSTSVDTNLQLEVSSQSPLAYSYPRWLTLVSVRLTHPSRVQTKSPFLIWKVRHDLAESTGMGFTVISNLLPTTILSRYERRHPAFRSTCVRGVSCEYCLSRRMQWKLSRSVRGCQVRRKRRRLGATTDPGLGFYVPSSPTSVDANPSSETAEPRSASSENYKIPQNLSQCHSPMEVDIQPPPGTPRESSSSPTPTPMLSVEGYLRRSAGGSRKRQKLKHIGLANNPRDTSPALHHAEGQSPPTITQPLTSTAPRRKRRTRSRPSRVKTTLVKGKAYRARSQKPKAVIDDLVRAALSTHVDVDEEFLEDGRNPPCRLDTRTTNGLTQNTPATVRRRNFVHPYKTQPFPCEPSLGNAPVDLELGRHPRKPMSAWEGTLVLSKLDIRVPTSTVTPRRKGRPIQGPSPSRVRGRYPKLPLTPLSPTPMPTSRGHTVPRNRYNFNIILRVIRRLLI